MNNVAHISAKTCRVGNRRREEYFPYIYITLWHIHSHVVCAAAALCKGFNLFFGAHEIHSRFPINIVVGAPDSPIAFAVVFVIVNIVVWNLNLAQCWKFAFLITANDQETSGKQEMVKHFLQHDDLHRAMGRKKNCTVITFFGTHFLLLLNRSPYNVVDLHRECPWSKFNL